jgi:hypothetical protein
MKIKSIALLALLFLTILGFTGCKKDELTVNKKNIVQLWKLDQYLINDVDKTSSLLISNYEESYSDNVKYSRAFRDKNGANQTMDGTYEFTNATRLKISGVGSIEFTAAGTASSSYYDIIKLTETQFWYSYTNGNMKHEFRLSKK